MDVRYEFIVAVTGVYVILYTCGYQYLHVIGRCKVGFDAAKLIFLSELNFVNLSLLCSTP